MSPAKVCCVTRGEGEGDDFKYVCSADDGKVRCGWDHASPKDNISERVVWNGDGLHELICGEAHVSVGVSWGVAWCGTSTDVPSRGVEKG